MSAPPPPDPYNARHQAMLLQQQRVRERGRSEQERQEFERQDRVWARQLNAQHAQSATATVPAPHVGRNQSFTSADRNNYTGTTGSGHTQAVTSTGRYDHAVLAPSGRPRPFNGAGYNNAGLAPYSRPQIPNAIGYNNQAGVATSQAEPAFSRSNANAHYGQHRAPEPVFQPDVPLVPFNQRILPQRPVARGDRIGVLNSGTRANNTTDDRRWSSLFPAAESRTPPPQAVATLPNQMQPIPTHNGDRATPSGFTSMFRASTRDGHAPAPRFPLRISRPHRPNEFVAPLPWVTEDDRQLQQTVVDPGRIAPFFWVRDPSEDARIPRSSEPEHIRRERIELGRYGDIPFHLYATNPAYPPHTPDGRMLPLQSWMPPYHMPRHPAMAYWGHNLNERADNPLVSRLPQILVWSTQEDPTLGGTFLSRPMFEHLGEHDTTDRGWGPGIRVHQDLQPSLARATEYMQREVMRRDAAMFNAQERVLNQAAGIVQEPSPVEYSPDPDDHPMDGFSSDDTQEDNDDERDSDWQEGQE